MYLKLFHNTSLKNINIHWRPMKETDLLNYYKRSDIIVDINNVNQTGLSMRVIEAIGCGKKILTTNNNIFECISLPKEYVSIINQNFEIDINFISQRTIQSALNIQSLYIENWLDTIFNNSVFI
jgi:hypothetical protein